MSERKKRWKPGSDFLSSTAAIWMVPLLALFIGIWMLFQHWYSQGPSFTLTVATTEGIVAGKTVIRSREVEVGRIEAVELSEDYSHAVLKARLTNAAAGMLKKDSQFWVIKPRVGREGSLASAPCSPVPISNWRPARRARRAMSTPCWTSRHWPRRTPRGCDYR